jgi:hypothetical protein
MANPPNRYFPERQNYQNHQQWQDAVTLHQGMYDLQDAHAATSKKVDDVSKSKTAPKPFTGDIQGIPIKGATDPSTTTLTLTTGSIKNGDTLRYNSATGNFEFGT